LLVSSRRRLGLAGEQRFPLEGLPVPAPGDGPDDLARNPAVALFFDRARSVHPDLQPDAHMLAAVGSLVRVVGGVPLALELAASRVGAQSPAQLTALLSGAAGGGCLPLLARAGPRAGYDPRHASIEEVIDWSWRLASPGQQALLAALSCFAGDAGLKALAAMRVEPPSRVAAELDELAGQSLLRVLAASGSGRDEVRFALLEPVREFIRSRWPPLALRELREALSRWLLQWAAGLSPAFEPASVAQEVRTVLHTLSHAVESPARALELALALRAHWESAGMPSATQQALADALAAYEAGVPDPMLASASHEMLATLTYEVGSASVALEHAEAAVRWAGADGRLRARALVRRAFFDLMPLTGGAGTQDPPARVWLDEALALARLHADREGQALALQYLAALARLCRADWSQAESLLAQAQVLWLALGDRRKAVGRLIQRGHCWMRLGRVEEAQACFEQCERSARELDDVHGCIHSLLNLSSLFEEGRRWDEALEVTRRCIDLCWQHQFLYPLGCVLWNMPVPLAHLRQPAEAMRLVAFASRFWQATYGPLTRNDRLSMRRVRRLVSAQLGTAAAETYWIDGACMDLPRAVALALQTDARDAADGPSASPARLAV
jgi:tetratricopeptide (TPR) repeat protein